jgi:Domain of unknown function (DUF4258)
MAERRISEEEVEEVLANADIETPGTTSGRMNIWGRTESGRRLRITTYRDNPDFIITVVALDEEA